MTPSVAEEANASSAGNNRACSNGRSRKNECGNDKRTGIGHGAPPRRDPYAMEVDKGRNCYTCRGFGHMAHHCRNRRRGRVADRRRLKYRERNIKGNCEYLNNLKEEENLESLD